jgi:tellurite resistance protein TerC
VVVVWFGFAALILFLLALDLGVFHRKAHAVSAREGLAWSIVWATLALTFTIFIYQAYEHKWFGLGTIPDAVDRTAAMPQGAINDGSSAVVKYLTGYVVEQSLSVDNMFVMAVLFRMFAVPAVLQHRVLFWGILGALSMRGVMIAIGTTLVTRFSWVLYVFGAFLIFTAFKMLFANTEEEQDPADNPVVRFTRRFLPTTKRYYGNQFIIRRGKALILTPLALALVVVEATDLVFAVDSIPAIFAITADPFLVFASNAFAILGLRSLYFVLAGALTTFRYLKVSLAIVLAMVGGKMLAHHWLQHWLGEHFNLYLLGAIVLILGTGVGASMLRTQADRPEAETGPPEGGRHERKSSKAHRS